MKYSWKSRLLVCLLALLLCVSEILPSASVFANTDETREASQDMQADEVEEEQQKKDDESSTEKISSNEDEQASPTSEEEEAVENQEEEDDAKQQEPVEDAAGIPDDDSLLGAPSEETEDTEDDEATTVDVEFRVVPLGTEEEQQDIETILKSSRFTGTLCLYRKLESASTYSTISTQYGFSVAQNSSYTWKDMPRYDANGNKYVYAVRLYNHYNKPYALIAETGTGEYLPEIDDEPNVFRFGLSAATDTVTVRITWDDENDQAKLRPESIEGISLSYGDPDHLLTPDAENIVKNSDGSYTVTWNNVPRVYNNAEASLEILQPYLTGYTSTKSGSRWSYSGMANTITVTNKLNATKVKVTLRNGSTNSITKDMANQGGFAFPTEVTATLYKTVNQERVKVAEHTFNPTTATYWSNNYYSNYTFVVPDDEDADASSEEATWEVEWSDEFDSAHFITDKGELTGSNKNYASVMKVIYPYYQINSTVLTYDDDDNSTGVRPAAGTMQLVLYADGEPVETVSAASVPAANSNTVGGTRFLPVYADELEEDGSRRKIEYTFVVDGAPAYYEAETAIKEYYGNVDTRYMDILQSTLKLTLKKQTMTVNVKWEDQNHEEPSDSEIANRPDNLNLALYYSSDGGETWNPFWGKQYYSVTASEDSRNTWTYTWDALPAVDEEGNPIIFKAEQVDKLSRYTTNEDEPQVETLEDGSSHTTQVIHNSYNDNWNYAIDLYWDRTDASEKY